MEGFLILHFNSRSLYTNFVQIKDYLKSLKHSFQVIAKSETWLTSEKGADFLLERYDIYFGNRINKRGGDVAFYVQKNLQCKETDCTFIYRTPGSCIAQFTLADLLGKICGKKSVFVCGDFHIDLLKWNEHKLTTDFCNTMFSFGLWPLIDKPTSITKESATLMDNIFTNAHEKLTSGLLVNDISNHLPIFVNLDNLKVNSSVSLNEPTCKFVRIRTPERIEALKLDLADYSWDKVYAHDPNQAHDAFLFAFLEVYNKHCPVRRYLVTENKYN